MINLQPNNNWNMKIKIGYIKHWKRKKKYYRMSNFKNK